MPSQESKTPRIRRFCAQVISWPSGPRSSRWRAMLAVRRITQPAYYKVRTILCPERASFSWRRSCAFARHLLALTMCSMGHADLSQRGALASCRYNAQFRAAAESRSFAIPRAARFIGPKGLFSHAGRSLYLSSALLCVVVDCGRCACTARAYKNVILPGRSVGMS